MTKLVCTMCLNPSPEHWAIFWFCSIYVGSAVALDLSQHPNQSLTNNANSVAIACHFEHLKMGDLGLETSLRFFFIEWKF